MPLTYTQIQAKVTPKLRGTTLDRVPSFDEKCREAAGNVLLHASPLETIRRARIENAIYSHIFNYTGPTDLKGNNNIIDIRPIGVRSSSDDVAGRFGREFDIRKGRDTFTVEMINGVKTLRLSKRIAGHTVLHEMDSITNLTASGDVQNLDTNTLDYVAGNGSVQFGLSGATGSGTIEIALASQIDLSDMEDIGSLFHWLNFPDATRLTSVSLRWGNDSSNYWSKTITSPHDRSAFESNAFTLLRADWQTASETGSPVSTAVDYLAIVFTYSSGVALSNVRLDNITAAKGQAYEVLYYSDRLFKTAAGTFIEIPTTGSDTLNLAIDGENLFIYELMLILIQELGQKSVAQNAKWFQEKLYGTPNSDGMYDVYNANYPAQAVEQQTTYHNFGDNSPADYDEED